ncbi:MAG: hypothetical protein V2J89_00760 [Halieaceae bacterium]|jgi:hypothetical protein|nr:hypothetical protein [Halieaceae bacterium]
MTRKLPFLDDIPPEAFNQPEDIAERAIALATGDYGALSGCFFHVSDSLDDLLQQADRIKAGRLHSLSLHGLEGLID